MTTNFDFQAHPLVAIWETNARSGPQMGDIVQFPGGDHMELTDREAEQLIRDIAELQPAAASRVNPSRDKPALFKSAIAVRAGSEFGPRIMLGWRPLEAAY